MATLWPPVELDPSVDPDIAAHALLASGVHGAGPGDVIVHTGNIGQYAPAPDLTPYSTTAQMNTAIAESSATAVTLTPGTSARNRIVAQNATTAPVVVQTAAAATANAVEVRDSADTLKAHITAAGAYGFGSASNVTLTAGLFELVTNYAFSATGLLRTNTEVRAQNFTASQVSMGAMGPGGEAGIAFGNATAPMLYKAAAGELRARAPVGTATKFTIQNTATAGDNAFAIKDTAGVDQIYASTYLNAFGIGQYGNNYRIRIGYNDLGAAGVAFGTLLETGLDHITSGGGLMVRPTGGDASSNGRLFINQKAAQSVNPFEVRTSAGTGVFTVGTAGAVYAAGSFTSDGNYVAGGNTVSRNNTAAQVRTGNIGPAGEAGVDFNATSGTPERIYRSAAGALTVDNTTANTGTKLIVKGNGTGAGSIEIRKGDDTIRGTIRDWNVGLLGIEINSDYIAVTPNGGGRAIIGASNTAFGVELKSKVCVGGNDAGTNQLRVISSSASTVGLAIALTASATANAFEIRSSADAVLAAFRSDGWLNLGAQGILAQGGLFSDKIGNYAASLLTVEHNNGLTFSGSNAVVTIPNLTGAAPAAVAGKGRIYVEAGALKYVGAGGTVTTLAPS